MDYKKLIIVAVVLIIIWGSLLYYMISYGEEVRNHPCSVCAKNMGEDVLCSSKIGQDFVTFSPNKENE